LDRSAGPSRGDRRSLKQRAAARGRLLAPAHVPVGRVPVQLRRLAAAVAVALARPLGRRRLCGRRSGRGRSGCVVLVDAHALPRLLLVGAAAARGAALGGVAAAGLVLVVRMVRMHLAVGRVEHHGRRLHAMRRGGRVRCVHAVAALTRRRHAPCCRCCIQVRMHMHARAVKAAPRRCSRRPRRRNVGPRPLHCGAPQPPLLHQRPHPARQRAERAPLPQRAAADRAAVPRAGGRHLRLLARAHKHDLGLVDRVGLDAGDVHKGGDVGDPHDVGVDVAPDLQRAVRAVRGRAVLADRRGRVAVDAEERRLGLFEVLVEGAGAEEAARDEGLVACVGGGVVGMWSRAFEAAVCGGLERCPRIRWECRRFNTSQEAVAAAAIWFAVCTGTHSTAPRTAHY